MIRTHACLYAIDRPLTDEELATAASFDVLAVTASLRLKHGDIPKIIALNPDIELLWYVDLMFIHAPHPEEPWEHPWWSQMDPNEDWFIHALTGNTKEHRLVFKRFMTYTMDISKSGYTDLISDYYKKCLDDHPEFAGIFADDCWYAFHNTWNIWTTAQAYPDIISSDLVPAQPNFHSDMINFLGKIKSKIGGKLLIPNMASALAYKGDYIAKTDGKFVEGWWHPEWYGAEEYISKEDALKHGENLSTISATGKYYLAHSGIDPDDPGYTEENIQRIRIYSLAAFLIAQNGPKASFGWREGSYQRDWRFEEMNIDVGEPFGQAYKVNDDVYARNYTKVKAFVNISDSNTHTVEANGNTHTLVPHSGLIVPVTTPEPPPPMLGSAVYGGILGTMMGYAFGNSVGASVGMATGAVLGALVSRYTAPPYSVTCAKCGKVFMFTTRGVPVWCPKCGEEQVVRRG